MPRKQHDDRGASSDVDSFHGSSVIYQDSSDPLSRLRKLAEQSQHVLLNLKSMYPFDLYPDTLTIDSNKVNIIEKDIFRTENVHSVLVENITNVSVGTGVFSASLQIVDSSNYRYPVTYTIKHLRKTDALLARRLIQGLIAAKHEGIDLSICNGKDALQCLNILGYAKGENNEDR